MKWFFFELLINFLEMITSCYFASRLFKKELRKTSDIGVLIVFAVLGTILLIITEGVTIPLVSSIPAILTFCAYTIIVCSSKLWSVILWSLINYMLIGIISISISSFLSMLLRIPLSELVSRTDVRVVTCVIIRLLQLLISQIIIIIIRKFRKIETSGKNDAGLITSVTFSILALTLLWYEANLMNEDLLLLFNMFICVLCLLLNFGYLIFNEILLKEKVDNHELKIQNQLISLQLRNQSEVNEIYNSIRSLKHDINNHLYSISGYLQIGEYEKAMRYIERITGIVEKVDGYHTGNRTVDALFASKSTLAKANNIKVSIEAHIPEELKIAAEHLTIILGNLFDNAIDANITVESLKERYIVIKLSYIDSNLMIYFENRANEKEVMVKDRWYTTKKNKIEHGFGIKNIDRIVKIYDGFCERGLKEHTFVCSIRIPDIVC